jgi:hypothetical protein
MNPVQTLPRRVFNTYFNIIFPSMPRPSKQFVPSDYPPKPSMHFSFPQSSYRSKQQLKAYNYTYTYPITDCIKGIGGALLLS